jgi:hypothetical protein
VDTFVAKTQFSRAISPISAMHFIHAMHTAHFHAELPDYGKAGKMGPHSLATVSFLSTKSGSPCPVCPKLLAPVSAAQGKIALPFLQQFCYACHYHISGKTAAV